MYVRDSVLDDSRVQLFVSRHNHHAVLKASTPTYCTVQHLYVCVDVVLTSVHHVLLSENTFGSWPTHDSRAQLFVSRLIQGEQSYVRYVRYLCVDGVPVKNRSDGLSKVHC